MPCSEDLQNGFVESCFCCGRILLPSESKRRKSQKFLMFALENYWLKTNFVWQYVNSICANTDKTMTIPACMACIHWVSRTTKTNKKNLLLLDEFILFTKFPLQCRPPDSRLLRRFVEKLTVEFEYNGLFYRNPYKAFFADSIWELLCDFTKNTKKCKTNGRYFLLLDKITYTWWKEQGRITIFKTKKEAKRMRKLLHEQHPEDLEKLLETLNFERL